MDMGVRQATSFLHHISNSWNGYWDELLSCDYWVSIGNPKITDLAFANSAVMLLVTGDLTSVSKHCTRGQIFFHFGSSAPQA